MKNGIKVFIFYRHICYLIKHKCKKKYDFIEIARTRNIMVVYNIFLLCVYSIDNTMDIIKWLNIE